MRRSILWLALAAPLVGCPPEDTDTEDTAPDPVVEAIEATPSTVRLVVGAEQAITVTARLDDDTTQDVSSAATYRVVNGSVAEVDADGVVTAIGAGTTDIEVTYGDFDDVVRLTVTTNGISGQLTLLGMPVSGVIVRLSGDGDDEDLTDINGAFQFSDLASGDYIVETDFVDAPRDDEPHASVEIDGSSVDDVDLVLTSAGYPIGRDAFEPDDAPGSAKTLPIGTLQHRTHFGDGGAADGGDVDFMTITVETGKKYEIFTTGLCASCDTLLYLMELDGLTEIDSNDDFLRRTSRVLYTADANENLLVKTTAYQEDYGVTSYFVGFRVFVDADADDYSAPWDCAPNDDTRHPVVAETAADSVDSDCDGADPGADADEPNDNRATAVPLASSTATWLDYSLDLAGRAAAIRTLSASDTEDWYSVVVPARSGVDLFAWHLDNGVIEATFYGSDGTTSRDDLKNTTDAAVTYYVKVTGDPGAYFAQGYSLGTDQDRDGFYSRDWDEDRDCDDNNGTVSPEANGDPCNGNL
jgi:hypothetical protein